MRSRKEWTQTLRLATALFVAGAALPALMPQNARAGERQFLVILANSPKQYPGPERSPLGQPTLGLPNKQLVLNQYFDTDDPETGSFAEYWEEISYGDVRISGDVTDWISLQWAIQPPLVDPTRDNPDTGPPVGDNLANPQFRNSPANFYDLDGSGGYRYGASEYITNWFAAMPIDIDGDPGGNDNGPHFAGPGSSHATSQGYRVWKPGERFIDMDEDGRWDGLDEATNSMDWDGDHRPDLRGPWVDLNRNGAAENPGECIYLRDSDNDGNPDCCPDGPGRPGCEPYKYTDQHRACDPTRWSGPNGDIEDCNGNLIPDACDISQVGGPTPACIATGWLATDPSCALCGASRDDQPFEGVGMQCLESGGNGIPDECEYENPNEEPGCVPPGLDPDSGDPCAGEGFAVCRNIADNERPSTNKASRCEYDNDNGGNLLDVVEPFENFMRRWDPCVFDPDVSGPNLMKARTHWIKVYDPDSPSLDFPGPVDTLTCSSPEYTVDYGDPSYIENNYPANTKNCSISGAPCNQSSDCSESGGQCRSAIDQLIMEAEGRVLWGEHDPLGLGVYGGDDECVCANGQVCSNLPLGGVLVYNVCPAGVHRAYDPPDSFQNMIATNGPDETDVYTTKMQIAPTRAFNVPNRLLLATPLPGTFVHQATGRLIDKAWYEQAWADRYGGELDEVPQWPGSLLCKADGDSTPPYTDCSSIGAFCDTSRTNNDNDEGYCSNVSYAPPNVPLVVPYLDPDPDLYEPEFNRRFFKANAGGTRGDGRGWIGCDTNLDPVVVFETGLGEDSVGFDELCNHPILPEEVDGEDEAGIFFDGWVEHDDLPSSKYHTAGDQRFGEVTSPFLSTYDDYEPPGYEPGDDPTVVAQMWGEDRADGAGSTGHDRIIPAAGPYALNIHGNNGRDAGNVMMMELLSWRTNVEYPHNPRFNRGSTWERDLLPRWPRTHPYAGLPETEPGAPRGFRDYNLDGLIDQGECRHAGSENYQVDSAIGTTNNALATMYPFHRDRLVEDCIEILDELKDFDDFVDPVAMEQVRCAAGVANRARVPAHLGGHQVYANGFASGIILLPLRAFNNNGIDFNNAPSFVPIHNEDNDDLEDMFPAYSPRISWNLFFHDLVWIMEATEAGDQLAPDFQTGFSAHEYLHSWEALPDLYDYDIYEPEPRPPENCPIGRWDIMANGGLVHPTPILKESPCTEWIKPVNLKTVLTPGVDATVTLPPAEFTRDNSYFFLENENRRAERYYFWSAGSGFDERMPGNGGMLIMHTDFTPRCTDDAECPEGIECVDGFCEGANPDALPAQQRNGTRFSYQIVQADGLNQLIDCSNRGDGGDLWPGTTNATRFNFDTNPPARWFAQNSWIGIDILDIIPDDEGSVQLKINWMPTSIPSLRFLKPPGGVSVPVQSDRVIYTVKFQATDVFGGTTIRLYYMKDEKTCSGSGDPCEQNIDCPIGQVCTHDLSIIQPSHANQITQLRKTTPGTNSLSADWNIYGVPDDRYVVAAELVPGAGADGNERSHTDPQPWRSNVGNGWMTVDHVDIAGRTARSETWAAVCVDTEGSDWRVNGTLTQPVRDYSAVCSDSAQCPEGLECRDGVCAPAACEDNTGCPAGIECLNGFCEPYPHATTDVPYTSIGGGVTFTIHEGNIPFELGDSFSFTSTGVTAMSRGVTIIGGQIKEDPIAIIHASPLAGDPPLTVTFDGRDSIDPNGEPLTFRWNYGDGSAEQDGAVVQHTYVQAGTFTAVLRATKTDPLNQRFGEAAVDIDVTNNSPTAVISATPRSGPVPLTVQFSGAQSSDTETAPANLTYHWNFGDGNSANDARTPGTTFQNIDWFYRNQADGTPCTHEQPCDFIATLTVTDEGGKEDSDTVKLRVGNTDPVPNIAHTSLQGADPFTVTFNAKNSFDADGDDLYVTWTWGDAGDPAEETFPAATGSTDAMDGGVPHGYVLPAGQTSGSFQTTAVVRDCPPEPPRDDCGEAPWAGVTVTVTEAVSGSSEPRAAIYPTCDELRNQSVGESFAVDGSFSFDRPVGSELAGYVWDWGDGSPGGTGVIASHAYTAAGTYTLTLTVADDETPPNTNSAFCTIVVTGDGGGGGEEPPLEENKPPTAFFTVNPQRGFAGVTMFTFDGSNSKDPDGGGEPLSFFWSFGDGDSASGAVVTHKYRNAGAYLVRLTVSDEFNASTESTQEVTVEERAGNLPPHAFIATGPRTGTAPLSLTFDGRNSFDPDADPLEFRWVFMFNGHEIDMLIGETVTRLFGDPGTYTVELEVSDGRGGMATAGPETILVTARVAPPDDEEPEQPVPDGDEEEPTQPRLCGLGMLMSLFSSLLGLSALRVTRRRYPR